MASKAALGSRSTGAASELWALSEACMRDRWCRRSCWRSRTDLEIVEWFGTGSISEGRWPAQEIERLLASKVT